jgi:CheY-like chemotaxis protein
MGLPSRHRAGTPRPNQCQGRRVKSRATGSHAFTNTRAPEAARGDGARQRRLWSRSRSCVALFICNPYGVCQESPARERAGRCGADILQLTAALGGRPISWSVCVTKQTPIDGRAAAQGPTILLVDDEPSIVRGLAALLRQRGYEVLTAQSGSAAVRIAAGQRVDVAVIDYHIPDWRGDVVLAALMAHQPHLGRRTVMMSGDFGDRVRDVTAHTGCLLLIKPFDVEDLVNAVQRLLSAI